MDDPVIAALEVRRQRRQPAGEVAEEAVVEPPYPCLCGADDMRAVVVFSGNDLKVGDHVDEPEPRDQVALHRTRQQHLEAAGHEVDQQRELAVPLGAGELQILAAHQLGRDRQPAFDLWVGEHRPGDVANAGERTRAEADRHAHRPGRAAARAPRHASRRNRYCRTERAARSAGTNNRRSRRVRRASTPCARSCRSYSGTEPTALAGRSRAACPENGCWRGRSRRAQPRAARASRRSAARRECGPSASLRRGCFPAGTVRR